MNCDRARQLIRQHFDENNPLMDRELRHHLDGCPDCKMVFTSFKRVNHIMEAVKNYKPVLKHPISLTDEIMGSLDNLNPYNQTNIKTVRKSLFGKVAFRRLVAAAAIVLFGMLSYEQYIVLDKINKLETHLSEAAGKQGRWETASWNLSWETKTISNFIQLKSKNKAWMKKIKEIRERMVAMDMATGSPRGDIRMNALQKKY